jgi:two-component system, NarL family, sensor histidine kinase UhpB
MIIPRKLAFKAFLFLVFQGMIWQVSFAQSNRRVDSLQNLVKTLRDDTTKANALSDLSGELWHKSRYEEAKAYGNQGLALAERLNFKDGIARISTILGMICDSQGDYYEALKNHQTTLRISLEKNDTQGMGDAYNNIGLIYWETGNYPEALKCHLASLKFSESKGDKYRMSSSYTNIGIIYDDQGNYAEAMKYYTASLKISEERKFNFGIGICHGNIGVNQRLQGNYPEALASQNKALKVWEKMDNKDGISSCYAEMAEVYHLQKNYSEALTNYNRALKLSQEIGDKRGVALQNIRIGEVYTLLGKKAEAKQFLLNGLSISKAIGHKENIRSAYSALAQLDSLMGNYQQALRHYKLYTSYKDSLLNETNTKQIAQMKEQYESEKKDREILQLENDKQKLESEKDINQLLIKTKQDSLYLVQTQKEKVQLENEKILALNLYSTQQIVLLDNEKQVQRLETEKSKLDYVAQKAETERKQTQLTILGKEKTIQQIALHKQKLVKNYLLAGIVLLLVASFFAYNSYSTRQKLKLQTLRNKIASDLHDDVGSTLSSISIFSQMAQAQSKETIPALETIGESSRKMLDAMADIVWTINPENDQFEKIILRMRSFAYELLGAKNIDFEFDADEDIAIMKLSMEARKNLYLIFKEATNNMVKYAGASKAFFALKAEKNSLTMLIRDNGRGFDLNKSSAGNGLKNMRKRATEIGGELLIESFPELGTTIQLRLAV